MQTTFGETGQSFYKSTYFDKSKIGNNIIDFDIDCINRALAAEGRVGVSSEKIASRVWEHYVDANRLVKRCFGEKVKDDWNLYNWGLALTQEFGLEQDRVELLVLIYGKTIPNRLKLSEFELVILKHTSFKSMEKQERKHKWLDVVASFRVQSIKLRPGDGCWTIGKRQLRKILDVNDLAVVFDVTTFTSDLKRGDRYANKLHMLLVDDPWVSGKRLSAVHTGVTLEAQAIAERRRLEQFKRRIAAEEKEDEGAMAALAAAAAAAVGDDTTPQVPTIWGASEDAKAAADDDMRKVFNAKSKEKRVRAAERALKMAQKAAARAAFLREDEERRQRVAAYLARMRAGGGGGGGGGAGAGGGGGDDEATAQERQEIDDIEGNDPAVPGAPLQPQWPDTGGDDDDDDDRSDGKKQATQPAPTHTVALAELPPEVILTPDEQLRLRIAARLVAHQQRLAEGAAAEKRRLNEMVLSRLEARRQRLAAEAAAAAAAVAAEGAAVAAEEAAAAAAAERQRVEREEREKERERERDRASAEGEGGGKGGGEGRGGGGRGGGEELRPERMRSGRMHAAGRL